MHVLVRAVPLAIVSMAVVCNRRGYAYDGDALLWSTHYGYSYSTPCTLCKCMGSYAERALGLGLRLRLRLRLRL